MPTTQQSRGPICKLHPSRGTEQDWKLGHAMAAPNIEPPPLFAEAAPAPVFAAWGGEGR